MSRKNVLHTFQTITNTAMSADITSAVSDIQYLDNVALQLDWTGSPLGSISIQGSVDYEQDTNGNVTNPGHWVDLGIPVTLSAGSPALVNCNQLAFPYIRVVYTNGGATASILNAYIFAKMI